jgi:Tetratricopeptide repeat
VTRHQPRDWESPAPRRASTWFSNLNARALKKLESKIDPESLVDVADRQLDRSQRHSGESSRASVAMLQNKARYLRQAGRIDEALIVSNSAFSQRLQYQGAEHPDTLDTELRLAVLLAEFSRFEDAEPHFAHVVEASARMTDFDHAAASVAAKWLAHTRRMLQRDEE